MLPSIVTDLTNQLQNYHLDAEAIIAGCDELEGHIFVVNGDGLVTCHSDIGFTAIGIGAGHSKSYFMQSGCAANSTFYSGAIFTAYTAKKRAEIAPGVGTETDMYLVTRDGFEEVLPQMRNLVKEIYDEQEDVRKRMNREGIDDLSHRADEIFKKKAQEAVTPEAPKAPDGTKI